MSNSSHFSLLRTYSRLKTPKHTYPVLDQVVLGYIALVLLVQVLLQISPVVSVFARVGLISIQTWLGLLGGALLAADFFTNKRSWQAPYLPLLLGILLLAAVAALRTVEYGVKENLFKLCWAAIHFTLFYSCAHRAGAEKLKQYGKRLFLVLLVIWLVACCISLYQFARLISYDYVVNPLAQDAGTNRQGFYDNRLFGIFYTLNHAAYTSFLLLLVGLYFALRTKKIAFKVLYGFAALILLCHIVASQSRSAIVALYTCAACLAFFVTRRRLKKKTPVRLTLSFGMAVLAVGMAVLGLQALKLGLAHVPSITASVLHLPEVSYDAQLFERVMDDNASNGRFSIWRDYLSLWWEIGPMGISPGNYMAYIHENHQELYIVDFIRTHWPERYDSGIIYHMHSGYLMVYVSAGWLGAALLLAFGCACVARLVKKVKAGHVFPNRALWPLLLVTTVAISAVFDEGIFFQNNPQTSLFWLALGFLMKECGPLLAPAKDA